MRCFYHHDKEAVGQCRYCGKGLCPECTADLDGGLACRNRCEDKVRALVQMIDRNIKFMENPTKMSLVETPKVLQQLPQVDALSTRLANHIRRTYHFRISVAASYGAIGVLLFAGGITREILFLAIAGVCCVGFGIHTFLQARKLAPRPKPPETKARQILESPKK